MNQKIQRTSIHVNKKANFDYDTIETLEAGVILHGWEVKALREKSTNLKGSYVSLKNDSPVVIGWHITPYRQWGITLGQNPTRDRTLLLKSKDIIRISEKIKTGWLTLIPREIYFKGNLLKVEVSLVRWRKDYNKKQLLKERTLNREAEVAMKHY